MRRIEVGDTKQTQFYPQVKFMAWNNECNLSVRLKSDDVGSVGQYDNKFIWTDEKGKTASIYQLEDGNIEFDLKMDEKPESNIITYTIKTKGFNFFYQPELTDEEKLTSYRPDNVVGSYAVYHKDKKHNMYKTGKAYHIYRPWAEDANGNKVWCDMHIDVEKELLTITIPQDFLDSATYPVLLDPTFGDTSTGGTTSQHGRDYALGYLWTMPATGNLQKITMYAYGTDNTNCRMNGGIWESSHYLNRAGDYPVNLTTTTQWYDLPFTNPPSLTGSTQYYFGFCSGCNLGPYYVYAYYDTGATSNVRSDATNSYPGLVTLGADYSYYDRQYSIYMTYNIDSGYGLYYRKSGATHGSTIWTYAGDDEYSLPVRINGATGYVNFNSGVSSGLLIRRSGTTYGMVDDS